MVDVHKIHNWFLKNSINNDYIIQNLKDESRNHLLIIGAMHGHETCGAEAIYELLRTESFQAKLMSADCSVSWALGNPEAFYQRKKWLINDMNRAFTDENLLKDNPESSRAYKIVEYGKNYNVTHVLDLHSVTVGDFKMSEYSTELSREFEQSIGYDFPILMTNVDRAIPGVGIVHFGRLGIQGCLIECGNNHNRDSVKIAQKAIKRAINFVDESVPNNKQEVISKTTFEIVKAIYPHKGFKYLIDSPTTGTQLSKGQVFATSDEGEMVADDDYCLLMPKLYPTKGAVDAGYFAYKK